MAAIPLTLWLGLAAMAGAISVAVLWLIGRWTPETHGRRGISPTGGNDAVFLFQDDHMFDHHSGALPDTPNTSLAWPELRAWFEPRFAGLPQTLKHLTEDQGLSIRSCEDGDTAELRLLRTQHGTRVTLCDPPHSCPGERHQMLAQRTRLIEETEVLHAAHYPIWKTSHDGTTLWQNAACRAAFDPDAQEVTIPEPDQNSVSRFSITPVNGGRPVWYEVHSAAYPSLVLHHAIDITKIVTAETMQKDFVQTLTKTFAYLTIGLAVFDRNRKLALFNPALVDLTSLPAHFLSAQPDLMAFFDNLRNRRVMPEPRSYATWRTQISNVIESAQGGLYQETWSLPNDVTYRVTGRPHPDGAVAFLFENISAEVMLARRFRAQLDLRQSALDCLPDAVMVIGADNVLAFCNAAATRLLGIDPDICFDDMTVPDLIGACAAVLPAPAVWRDIEASLRTRGQSGGIHKTVPGHGHNHQCRLEPLPGGACMMTLQTQPGVPQKAAVAAIAG
ncbi:PAS-domain containing protein [Roseovarius sp. M141]|uniref:PAS-domain containing protein n=1 Tax=Roseovarius sp. M141 TaxID=2583806 RepID=UPI0020CD03E9|nr:PAS-domain containing protein [Roseovarius sp. M141]MCQ0091477.1 PAS domain-containing protein [Roseovarius sp. M141]